jgi:medium-chain acyl-[acyl-carrier-protein] hydrolase
VTSGAFTLRMFPGNHFFIHSAESLLLQTLSADLDRALKTPA